MNYSEAEDSWKSNDEWRYADKEAAWKFFFAAGKESSQTVISAQCVKMSQYESIIFELRAQLAAAQEECEFQRNAHKQAEELMLEQSNQLAAAILKVTKPLEKEIERLKTVPMKYRRMAFNAQLQDENNELRTQLAAAQEANEHWQRATAENENKWIEANDKLAKAEQRVAEACALQVATETKFHWLDAARVAKEIRSGEWCKFVKEV